MGSRSAADRRPSGRPPVRSTAAPSQPWTQFSARVSWTDPGWTGRPPAAARRCDTGAEAGDEAGDGRPRVRLSAIDSACRRNGRCASCPRPRPGLPLVGRACRTAHRSPSRHLSCTNNNHIYLLSPLCVFLALRYIFVGFRHGGGSHKCVSGRDVDDGEPLARI